MILESLLLAAASLQVAQGEVVAIGQDRQLFVDRHLIESTDGCELRLGTPRDEGPVFEFDAPWEGRFCGYSTVIAHEGGFLLYYRGLGEAGADGSDLERTCVAVSDDGKIWKAALKLEDGTTVTGGKASGSYPAAIQASSGLVHITYSWRYLTINHVVIDPERLQLRDMPDGSWVD